jgi:hypothetical protein
VIATLYLDEVLSLQSYVGGGLVVLGAIINIWSSMGQREGQQASLPATERTALGSWISMLLYPIVGCVLGALLLLRLGGMPPDAWSEVFRSWPLIAQELQQGQSTYVILLLVQASGWLIAWVSVLLMGCLALSNLVRLAFQSPRTRRGTDQPAQVVRQIQPTRRVRPATQPALQPQMRPPVLPPAQQPSRPRVTTRLSEPPLPPQQSPRPRVTTRLPESPLSPQQPAPPHVPTRLPVRPVRPIEHPTWYGDAVWNRVAVVGLGPDTPPPVTEPLPLNLALPIDQIETQKYLYMEKLDA